MATQNMERRNLAILIFDDVEVLDFAGPFEVFAVTDELNEYAFFNVFTVAETTHPITAKNGLSINPDYMFQDCPTPNILLIPGGDGTRPVLENTGIIHWIQRIARDAELVLSVCSGALVLAKAGLLEGLQATTHHQVLRELSSLAPNTRIMHDQRYVDNGSVMTSAGISAGIDMSLYVVEKLLGKKYATKTRKYMEYGAEQEEKMMVDAQYFTFGDPPHELILESGEKLGPITLAYETYGELNQEKSNAILMLHAFSGDAHVAGYHEGDLKPGWWNDMIGPGKAFDTDKYFILCSNVVGGCQGSTGPANINPNTGSPYALDFPLVTIGDMVNCQKKLIEHFGIEKLLSIAGGSMGGMQVLAWMTMYPECLCSAIPIATAFKHSPQQIAFDEVGRQAIMADPNWKEGNYYGGPLPARGLAVARMIGHITYMSDKSMEEKFGRHRKQNGHTFKFTPDFEVEGYLSYHGDSFVKRFDANSYLYISKAMDNFDALDGRPLQTIFNQAKDIKVLIIAFKSDWLYPAYQSKEIVRACKLAGLEVTYCEIESTYGHDAFLLEFEEETLLVTHFLRKIFYGYEVT